MLQPDLEEGSSVIRIYEDPENKEYVFVIKLRDGTIIEKREPGDVDAKNANQD